MSALTQEVYQDPDFFNPDRWVDFTSTEMVLLDPANGNPYKPGEPPEWIMGDERLANGYNLLGKVGMNHALTIVMAPHGAYNDLDFSSEDPRGFEREVALSNVCAWEQVQWSRTKYGGLFVSPDYKRTSLMKDEERDKSKSFRGRVLEACELEKTPLFSYDVEDSEVPLDMALSEMTLHGIGLVSPRLNPYDTNPQAMVGLDAAGDYLRNFYIPGKYLHEVHKVQHVLGERLKATMSIGIAHQVVPRIFREFGLDPAVIELPPSDPYLVEVLDLLSVVSLQHGRVSREVADRILEEAL